MILFSEFQEDLKELKTHVATMQELADWIEVSRQQLYKYMDATEPMNVKQEIRERVRGIVNSLRSKP